MIKYSDDEILLLDSMIYIDHAWNIWFFFLKKKKRKEKKITN